MRKEEEKNEKINVKHDRHRHRHRHRHIHYITHLKSRSNNVSVSTQTPPNLYNTNVRNMFASCRGRLFFLTIVKPVCVRGSRDRQSDRRFKWTLCPLSGNYHLSFFFLAYQHPYPRYLFGFPTVCLLPWHRNQAFETDINNKNEAKLNNRSLLPKIIIIIIL